MILHVVVWHGACIAIRHTATERLKTEVEMFEIICNGKKRTALVLSNAIIKARVMSIEEFEPAYIFGEQDPQNPFGEFVCGQRVDETDSQTYKIG
jgi:hypothetical protein